jgi:hypothetical protein
MFGSAHKLTPTGLHSEGEVLNAAQYRLARRFTTPKAK